jgi:hypothetical protein
MQINNLIETIRLKYNPEENIITIFNLNIHTERLLHSITELNFKINENSEKSLMFFSKDFSNSVLLDKEVINFNLTDSNIRTFTGSFNYDNQEKNIYKLRLLYNIDGEIKSEISLYERFLENLK